MKIFVGVLFLWVTSFSVVFGQHVLQKVVENYVQTYQSRTDWSGFLGFYADSVYMEDLNLGLSFKGKKEFAKFYDWPNEAFQKLSAEQNTFILDELTVGENHAIIRGRFQPFYWKGELQEWSGNFLITLYFNSAQKIVRQYDFVRYPKRFLSE